MATVAFESVGGLGARLGDARSVLVLASSRRHVGALERTLAGLAVTVFERAVPNVPMATVEDATRALVASGADTIVAVGGGSAIGLGKALRLTHSPRFVAVPTTYAGTDRTRTFAMSRDRDVQAGRDDRVLPSLVIHDVALTLDMPVALAVQSLCSALAHAIGVLATGNLDAAQRTLATSAARDVVSAIEGIVANPTDRAAREAAQRGAARCAELQDLGRPSTHHGLVQLLGGALGKAHAALHAVLLPHFLASLAKNRPAVLAELDAAIGAPSAQAHERATVRDLHLAMREAHAMAALPALAARLRYQLVAAQAPVTLDALGVLRDELENALATRPELPAQIARDAL